MDYPKAVSVLKLCATDAGMKASGSRVGHHQVWARDSMITLLGARFVPDSQIQGALQASIAQRRNERPGGEQSWDRSQRFAIARSVCGKRETG